MFYYGDSGALIVSWHDARVPHDFYIKNIFGKWNNEALTGRTLQACLIISQVTGQHFCCTDDEAVNFFWRNDDAGSISLGRAERASWFLQRKMRISSEDITRRQQLGRKPAGFTIPSEEAEALFSRIKRYSMIAEGCCQRAALFLQHEEALLSDEILKQFLHGVTCPCQQFLQKKYAWWKLQRLQQEGPGFLKKWGFRDFWGLLPACFKVSSEKNSLLSDEIFKHLRASHIKSTATNITISLQ